MLCEIQMNLSKFASVRETLHVYYSVYRASNWRSFEDLTGPERESAYEHLFVRG